jgi:hypothetical protein
MNKVERYECEHCHKLFKINKHFCFKDPANMACASCAGWQGYGFGGFDEGGERQDCAYCLITKDVIHTLYSNEGLYRGFNKSKGNRGYDCKHWQPRKKETPND